MTVFDMLDIDETEGIDPTEIEAIKATLSQLKVTAAGVAKHNDTTDTLAILKEMVRVVRRVANSGVHSVDELHQQFATNSAGQPAQALGAGSGTQPNPQPQVTPQQGQTMEDAALHVIMTSTQLPQGVKAAILRLITPSDPNHLPVATDGTPTELVTARNALAEEKDKNKSGSLAHQLAEAEHKLAEQQDENKSGSLAHQLKAAQRNAAGTNMVDKTAVKTAFDKVEAAWGTKRKARMNDDWVVHLNSGTQLDDGIHEVRMLLA